MLLGVRACGAVCGAVWGCARGCAGLCGAVRGCPPPPRDQRDQSGGGGQPPPPAKRTRQRERNCGRNAGTTPARATRGRAGARRDERRGAAPRALEHPQTQRRKGTAKNPKTIIGEGFEDNATSIGQRSVLMLSKNSLVGWQRLLCFRRCLIGSWRYAHCNVFRRALVA